MACYARALAPFFGGTLSSSELCSGNPRALFFTLQNISIPEVGEEEEKRRKREEKREKKEEEKKSERW